VISESNALNLIDEENFIPSYCEYVGIIYETSIAYTPQQNRVIEKKKKKTLVELANALL
jgi:hypothetical protein